MEELVRSGQAARILGVSRETLRRWEKRGIIKPRRKLPSGHRIYTLEQVYQLRGELEKQK